MSQKNVTAKTVSNTTEICPAQKLLRLLSGKLKPEIFCLAAKSSLRFSSLLRDIKGSNKQSLSIALKEMQETDLLEKVVIKQKPLHIEYYLTEKGKSLIPVFQQLEGLL
ncbi:winged helix-turn-helix transcriptional regulator [Chryseobacterium soli]|uniref:winged helix-turn-helix transcriptional regulator n=1 Tax=Chryseobacterium soli TaxID=445961 RepID=UPI00068AA8D5|nr:helix-turn-helix domain-containing protein [Chryseobacterium soli]